MKSNELRQKFLSFFEKRGHKVISSASLIPTPEVELSGTQKVLFTTAGMHPLIPYLLGQKHPQGKRLTNVQKCLRTDDINEIGDSVHCTFFEMLGNWSLGDPASPDGIGKSGYWKKEAIAYSWEFLTGELGLPKERIYISVFEGDKSAPFDEESFDAWKEIGVPTERIFKYLKKDNWWGPVGEIGPCGPDTEIFYDIVGGDLRGKEPSKNSERFIEIWNDVFMEYDCKPDGSYKPLAQKNVDTGMGLERMLTVLQGKNNIYETDLFLPVMALIEKKAGRFNFKDARIIADHLKASIFLTAENIEPSNKDQGYILRRLIRRSVAKADYSIDLDLSFGEIISEYLKIYGDYYPLLKKQARKIEEVINEEKESFHRTLNFGVKEFHKIAQESEGIISGKHAFFLQATHGLTIDVISDLAKTANLKVDIFGFDDEIKKHQEISRRGMEKKFAGGMGGKSPKIVAGHTATHLLQAALRQVLGDHVHQTGSNITEDRIRFDFSHHEKLTDQEIKKVEDLVNEKIKDNLPVKKEMMTPKDAKKSGAIGLFDEKYSNQVSVYSVGDHSAGLGQTFSKEICGGPHVNSTKEIGHLKIVKEEGLGLGKRRIYAKID